MAAARDTAPVHHKIVRILEIPGTAEISPAPSPEPQGVRSVHSSS